MHILQAILKTTKTWLDFFKNLLFRPCQSIQVSFQTVVIVGYLLKLPTFREKVPKVFSARQLSSYCPSILKERRKKERQKKRRKKAPKDCWKVKKDRRRCFAQEEKVCKKQQKTVSSSEPVCSHTCSQSERDQCFGKNWRWNTRNCDSLSKGERKKCRRVKRKRCVKREMRRDTTLSDIEAKKVCKKRDRKKSSG